MWGKVETFNITAHYAKCMWLLNKTLDLESTLLMNLLYLHFTPLKVE